MVPSLGCAARSQRRGRSGRRRDAKPARRGCQWPALTPSVPVGRSWAATRTLRAIRRRGRTQMKFGLLYEMETPRPWHDRSEYNVYWEALAQIELADRLGFDHVWEVEHHFLEEYSHSSAPEVFFGAVSQRTTNIRISHGVRLLPFNFNHPIKLAEQAAVLDIMSNGRVEFGTGRSTTSMELDGFGVDYERTRAEVRESLEIIVKAWTEDVLEYHGDLLDIPASRVVPKPIQRPHPPMWMA